MSIVFGARQNKIEWAAGALREFTAGNRRAVLRFYSPLALYLLDGDYENFRSEMIDIPCSNGMIENLLVLATQLLQAGHPGKTLEIYWLLEREKLKRQRVQEGPGSPMPRII